MHICSNGYVLYRSFALSTLNNNLKKYHDSFNLETFNYDRGLDDCLLLSNVLFFEELSISVDLILSNVKV